MESAALAGGFAAPAVDAARTFRAALDAMARPGRIVTLAGATPPAALSPAAGALLLALADAETPLWLAPSSATRPALDWIAFHVGAPAAARADAAFALGSWAELAPIEDFPNGTPDYPDRAATLIVELDRLTPKGATLCGPGVAGTAALSLPDDLAAARAARGPFPLGIDLFFTAGSLAAALPRSTTLQGAPCTSR